MAFNPDRFVVIDGVQISKTRALREGLIDEKGRIVRSSEQPASEGPGSTRARTSASTRKGSGGKTKATGDEAPAGDEGSDSGDDAAAADAGAGDQES